MSKPSEPRPEDLPEIVRGLIAEALRRKKSAVKPEQIKEGASLTRDLGIDSLDILQITAMVEKRYKLRLPEEELKAMDDLGTIVRVLRKHLAAGA